MPRLPRARLSDFDGLYSVYSLPNIVLPLVGGMIVDRWGVAKSLCLFTLLILLGQAIFAAACRCATLHSPPPPRTQTREVTTSPPDRHPVGPPVGPAPQHTCRQALDDLRSAEGVAIMAADVVRDHVPHAPQLLSRVRADALLQEDLGLCVRVVRVCTIDAEARRIDGRLCV